MFVVLCKKGDKIFSACKLFVKKDRKVTETEIGKIIVICHSEEIGTCEYINEIYINK